MIHDLDIMLRQRALVALRREQGGCGAGDRRRRAPVLVCGEALLCVGPVVRRALSRLLPAIAEGRYRHLGVASPEKLLGYAGNMAYQIVRLLDAPDDVVHARAFHLADDAPTTLRAFADSIARELGKGPPVFVPKPLALAAARAGHMLRALGLRDSAISSPRLANMRRSNIDIPIQATRDLARAAACSHQAGVAETVRWLGAQGLGARAAPLSGEPWLIRSSSRAAPASSAATSPRSSSRQVAVSSCSTTSPGGLPRCNVPEGAELVVESITSAEVIDDLFRKHRFRHVYHLAALAAEGAGT